MSKESSEDTYQWQIEGSYGYYGRDNEWVSERSPSRCLSKPDTRTLDKHGARFPQRPGTTACKHYMSTGRCSFGRKCKYDHPLNRQEKMAVHEVQRPRQKKLRADMVQSGSREPGDTAAYENTQLNAEGLPQNPGKPYCKNYLATRTCKDGVGCPFDHPLHFVGEKFLQATHKKAGEVLEKVEATLASMSISSRSTTSTQENIRRKGAEAEASPFTSDIGGRRNREFPQSSCGSHNVIQEAERYKMARQQDQRPANHVEQYLAGNPESARTSDMFLHVEGMKLPVSSSLFLIHSKVIGRRIIEAQRNPRGNSSPVVYLQESRREIELLLEFLYCTRTRIKTVDEAACLLRLAEKYEISHPIAICEQWLCQEAHRMHIGGINLNSTQPQQVLNPDSQELKNWNLAKWLQVSVKLDMTDFKYSCMCALAGFFFSASNQNMHLLTSVISDLLEYDVGAESLAQVMSVMGRWVNTLGHTWQCRKCHTEVTIPRSSKCVTCGQSYQQDCLQFGVKYFSELSPLFAADEGIILQLFKSIDAPK